jgi:hypothetical protein
MVVMHSCDNPPCVNPDHLSVGTKAENNADAARKGHMAAASRRRSKLTEDDVRAIRASTEAAAVIMARYDLSQASVSFIRNRKRWASLE